MGAAITLRLSDDVLYDQKLGAKYPAAKRAAKRVNCMMKTDCRTVKAVGDLKVGFDNLVTMNREVEVDGE